MKIILNLLLVLMCMGANAQIFPVQVSPQPTPPYSPFLSDYTSPGAQNLIVQIRTNDITLENYACKLRITLEGAGITLRTKEHYISQPLILTGGAVPQIFYGEDIAEYFHPDALDFSGITRREYEKNARLPEGVYRFSFEVLDYYRGTAVSNKGAATLWIIHNDPPLLNLPINFANVKVQEPTNILFTWTPRHTGSPNAAFSTEYVFRLLEIWPEDRNPNDAFLTQYPLFEITTAQNQLLYSVSEPALVPGKKYAWQVQARDTEGKDLFKNNGRSEVFVFRYGEALASPQNFAMRWAKPTTLAIRWDPVRDDVEEIKYRLQYRPRRRSEPHEWYETRTQFTEKTLYDLQASTEYEMRVRAEKIAQESAYSEIRVFKTLAPEENVFVCTSTVEPPPLPENSIPVFPLSINDTIHAGGYDVLIRDVIEIDGRYYGSGFAIVPWLNGAKVRVTFEKITVNDRFWLRAGVIKSVWNTGSEFLLQTQSPVAASNPAPQAGELDITIVASDSLIVVEGAAIVAVTKNDEGAIVLTTTDGKEQILPKGKSYAIVDELGNGYIIDKHGNIAKTTAHEARASATRGDRSYDPKFRFEKGEGRFGFDEQKFNALAKYHQQLEDGSYVSWKALSASNPDLIEGRAISGDIDISKVRFEAGSVPVVPVSSSEGKVKLRLSGKMAGMEEELLALYAPVDTVPEKVIGKINLATYNAIHHNLEIIPVNGALLPGGLDAAAISASLNSTFSQAVVDWSVTLSDPLVVALEETFDVGGTGTFSNYTADMKKVLKAHGTFRDNTYYLFLITEPRNESTLGYMPRNKQAGFVFIGPHNGDQHEFLKTIAHELGHGAFNLRHTFSEHTLPSGTTDNLMDYSSGTALYKYQWDHIHEPQRVVRLFEEEEGAMNDNSLANFYKQASPMLEEALFKEWIKKVRYVFDFFKACENESWISYEGEGVVPYCFWRNQVVAPSVQYSNQDRPFTAGLIDGAYLEAMGLYQLPAVVEKVTRFPGRLIYAYTLAFWQCRTESLLAGVDEYEYVIEQLAAHDEQGGVWLWVKEQWYDYKGEKERLEEYFEDCRDADDLRDSIHDLYDLASNWEAIQILSTEISQLLNEYWAELSTPNNEGRYERGKLIIPAASLILPLNLPSKLDRLKATLRLLQESSLEKWRSVALHVEAIIGSRSFNALNLPPRLAAIYDNCIIAGYKASDVGAEIIFKTTDDVVVAKLSEGFLHIRIPYETGWATQSKSTLAKEVYEGIAKSRRVYRLGTMLKNETAEAQYWSPESPFELPSIWDYAQKYGMPKSNLIGNKVFCEVGTIPKEVPYITREAPGFEGNLGGGIEIVVPSKSVTLESFSTIDIEK